jgi:limonene-1,2-epoxide hydrolase
MTDAEAFLDQYVTSMTNKDLDTLVACWHPDAEATHLLHPDRSWSGADFYRKMMGQIFASNAGAHMEIQASAISGNTVFIESVTLHGDGSRTPCVGIFELEDGRVRHARVYTDVPSSDGVKMEQFVGAMNAPEGSAG